MKQVYKSFAEAFQGFQGKKSMTDEFELGCKALRANEFTVASEYFSQVIENGEYATASELFWAAYHQQFLIGGFGDKPWYSIMLDVLYKPALTPGDRSAKSKARSNLWNLLKRLYWDHKNQGHKEIAQDIKNYMTVLELMVV